MARVVVVGGGVAGVAAALSASRLGAKVTLIESSGRVGLSKASLPLLVSQGLSEDDLILHDSTLLTAAGVEVRRNETVTSARSESVEVSSGAPSGTKTVQFDSLVVCTGAAAVTPNLRGLSKQGVFFLRGPSDYVELSRALDRLSRVAVLGPVPLALKLGEAVADRGKHVSVFCGKEGLERQFSGPVAKLVRRESQNHAAGSVTLVDDSFDAILGYERAEAVSSGGVVRTFDGVVVVPGASPSPPKLECERGPNGGLLVDTRMSTSLKGVFAAGDSAEIKFKSGSVQARLYSTSRLGGEVAGTNAAGGSARASPSWVMEQTYFGLEFCSAGLTAGEATAMGLDASAREGEFGERERETLVTMVYDQGTHEVYGLQVAGEGASSLSSAASMVVSLGLRLDELVLMEWPYSPGRGASPICLTAAEILAAEGA